MDFTFDQFTFAYITLAFVVTLVVGVWIGWSIQAHRAQQAIQAKLHAEMIAVRAGAEARFKDERLNGIERSQNEMLRSLRQLNQHLEFGSPGLPLLSANRNTNHFSQADGFSA